MKIWKTGRNLPLRIRRLGVIFLFFLAQPVPELLAVGAASLSLGSGVLLLSYAALHKREELAMRGPYAFCRNPAYLGMLLGVFAFCLAGGWSPAAAATSCVFLAASAVLYYRKILSEEELLERVHGEAFRDYKKRVRRRLFPSVLSGLRAGGFSLDMSFEAGIRNHSFKRVFKDAFWFLAFVARWYYLDGFHPFGVVRWTGRGHSLALTAALACALALFIFFKHFGRRYREAADASREGALAG